MAQQMLVSLEAIVALTGLNERMLQRLAQAGIIDKPKKDQYSFTQANPAIIRYFRAGKNVLDETSDGVDWEAERTKHQALKEKELVEKHKLNNQKETGELLARADMEALVSGLVVMIRTQLTQLPAELSVQLASLDSEKEVEALLLSTFEQLLHELSEASIRFGEHPSEPEDNELVDAGQPFTDTPPEANG